VERNPMTEGQGLVAGSCEGGKELNHSIKAAVFLD
jgi:hypothetical protein